MCSIPWLRLPFCDGLHEAEQAYVVAALMEFANL
jgi:hypothetical protein